MTSTPLESTIRQSKAIRLREVHEWTAENFLKKFGHLKLVHFPRIHQGKGNPVRIRTEKNGVVGQLEYQGLWNSWDCRQFKQAIEASLPYAQQPAERANLAAALTTIDAYAAAKERYRG